MSDSLNRHFLSAYGNDWVHTPNISQFAADSVVFDQHWLGSAPCMPARRDMLTGRLNFLEREWGGLEPFDTPLTSLLRRAGTTTHIETDHHHYFHAGGENYHATFGSWRLHRGQENDRCVSEVALPEPGHRGRWTRQYWSNRQQFASEADFPTPSTFQGGIDWLRRNADRENFLLWLEVFDPHEPFDYSDVYAGLYADNWSGPMYNWSGYEQETDQSAAAHLQVEYARCLSMMDHWFGKLVECLKQLRLYDDVLLILTADHGHMLGEHGVTGKNRWHAWNEMARLPLLVHLPGGRHAGQRYSVLTQNIDLMVTVLDYHGVAAPPVVQGRSWKNLPDHPDSFEGRSVLYGWFGQTVNLSDGQYTYLRAPANPANQPLFRHFLTPGTMHLHDLCDIGFYEDAEYGRFLPWTDWSVLRARARRKAPQDWMWTGLYDMTSDPQQLHNLAGTDIEGYYRDLLASTLQAHQAPPSQYERLGLSSVSAGNLVDGC
jgi:arylsulfatase A-like enzyme